MAYRTFRPTAIRAQWFAFKTFPFPVAVAHKISPPPVQSHTATQTNALQSITFLPWVSQSASNAPSRRGMGLGSRTHALLDARVTPSYHAANAAAHATDYFSPALMLHTYIEYPCPPPLICPLGTLTNPMHTKCIGNVSSTPIKGSATDVAPKYATIKGSG